MEASLKRKMYLAFVAVGAIVPYAVLLPWLMTHGLDLPRLVREATTSTGAMFFTVDVIVSALVVVWASAESITGWRLGTVIAMTLLVGVSAGLPLLLYFQAGASRTTGGTPDFSDGLLKSGAEHGKPTASPVRHTGGPGRH